MSLRVCTTSTDADLTMLANVKDELGLTDTAADQLLARLIRRASAWAETQLGQPVTVQTYQETVAGYGRAGLLLSRTPVRTVLRVFDATATGSAVELGSSEYRVEDAELGLLTRDDGFAWTVARPTALTDYVDLGLGESRPWLVEYSAGWRPVGSTSTADGTAPSSDVYTTEATVPGDVEAAVISKVKEWWLGRSLNPGLRSQAVGDLRLDYRGVADGPGAAERLLAPYRRLV